MSKQLNISEEIYKKFQAALVLTGEDEETVLNQLLIDYAHTAFNRVMGNQHATNSENTPISADRQKQLFTAWFRSLTKKSGERYNPITISGYTGRIESACSDPAFDTIPVKNLFTITSLSEFLSVANQITACPGYADFDAKSHNGFTAALKKYKEFLQFQENRGVVPMQSPSHTRKKQQGIHRWTIDEDTICCKRFLECYVVQKRTLDIVQFLEMLAKEVPAVSEGSLRMKIQNIKYLTMKAGIRDTSTIKWLSQYSLQCERVFQQALTDLHLK